jgi:hypothetical protein
MGTLWRPSMWAGYILCTGLCQEDGMATLLAFLWARRESQG